MSHRPEKQTYLVYLKRLRPGRRRNLTPTRIRNILVTHHSQLWNGKNLRRGPRDGKSGRTGLLHLATVEAKSSVEGFLLCRSARLGESGIMDNPIEPMMCWTMVMCGLGGSVRDFSGHGLTLQQWSCIGGVDADQTWVTAALLPSGLLWGNGIRPIVSMIRATRLRLITRPRFRSSAVTLR